MNNELVEKVRLARTAARPLACLPTEIKNLALQNVATALGSRQAEILAANAADCEAAKATGMDEVLLDRLRLDMDRLKAMAVDVLAVSALPDPIGEVFDMRTLPNGLLLGKKRVPLGVIAAVYESRPNVTVDIACLCLKSGNAVILRGGKETVRSNRALADAVRWALTEAGAPAEAIQLIEDTDRALVGELLKMRDLIDLVVPRGGAGLINYVRDTATMPVIAGGLGVCHAFVDRTAELAKAVDIVYNAKVQRPTVCNALDTVLVHKDIARDFLPLMATALAKAGVEFHGDAVTLEILQQQPGLNLKPAVADDWGKEFLALIAAVKIVDSLDEALEHIARYGSGHTEAIITENYPSAMRFVNEVDAAAVMVNASTRFTDGGQFGLGAEVGISTQKIHARGPMGLKEITSYKWICLGSGQVRP
ncbi:MAG: glutamate-5-semialdehyde dehydrogenase [Dehalococcoidia bacterium]|nr:glutamate-5-semialdehyde dehydrogenase [Dehalococcoidia bacterium]